MCFFDLFSYKIPMHRKWVRLKYVLYLLFDALFGLPFIFLMWASSQITEPSSKGVKEKHSWEITQCFYIQFFLFYLSLGSYYYCNDLSLSFLFRFVPREASNLSEVRFGDVAILKQFSVLHHKNSWKFSVYLLDLRFLVHMPQVISKLSLVEHFLIWATRNPLKLRPLSDVLFWQISSNICVCRFITFFLSSFDHGTFREVATVLYALYVVVLSWNLKQKGVDSMLCLH
jgi:hypothetical protein